MREPVLSTCVARDLRGLPFGSTASNNDSPLSMSPSTVVVVTLEVEFLHFFWQFVGKWPDRFSLMPRLARPPSVIRRAGVTPSASNQSSVSAGRAASPDQSPMPARLESSGDSLGALWCTSEPSEKCDRVFSSRGTVASPDRFPNASTARIERRLVGAMRCTSEPSEKCDRAFSSRGTVASPDRFPSASTSRIERRLVGGRVVCSQPSEKRDRVFSSRGTVASLTATFLDPTFTHRTCRPNREYRSR